MCYRFTTPLRRRPAHGFAFRQAGSRFRVTAGGKNGGIGMFPNPAICGVGKGTRTLDTRNHNPVL